MLEKFREEKLREIASLCALQERGELEPLRLTRPDFQASLRRADGIGVIAEYKRKSPSRGIICEDLTVEEVALQYLEAGASAISILTETRWFGGEIDFLERAAASAGQLPLLRKDFIFDPVQVLATSRTPASAFLLIARMARNATALRELREFGESLGLQAVVEVFDAQDLAMARESGARIIQVNARDLARLDVDRSACLDLLRNNVREAHETWIAASGMSRPEHLAEAWDAGYDAALIGTALMEHGRPGTALAALCKSCRRSA